MILEADTRWVSAFSLLETGAVAQGRKGSAGRVLFDSFCDQIKLDVVPFNAEHLRLARFAWERFGKGRHPAGLNLGDCCSYALARALGRPLLCKGNDFVQTDLDLVRY